MDSLPCTTARQQLGFIEPPQSDGFSGSVLSGPTIGGQKNFFPF